MRDPVVKRRAVLGVSGGLLLSIAAAVVWGADSAPAPKPDATFAQKVNLENIRLIALQNDGRFKTFDTMAREVVRQITGSTHFEKQIASGEVVKQDPVFTYLDMMFDPHAYRDIRVIYIKKKPIREALTLAVVGTVEKSELNAILKDGLVSMRFLQTPAVKAKLLELRTDVMRSAKEVDNLVQAATLTSASSLQETMRVIPPPLSTSAADRWYSVEALSKSTPDDDVHAGMGKAQAIEGMLPERQQELAKLWSAAGMAWRAGDAAAATIALNALAAELPGIGPQVYPPQKKLALEHWYYQYNKMTWTWWFYLVGVVFLMMAVVYRWPRARLAGLGLFALAFSLHTVASGIRWYLAGRIPNSNMFEAVTAAAWFGCLVAIFYELGPKFTNKKPAWRAAMVAVVVGFVTFVLSLTIRGVAFHSWQEWGPVPTVGLILFAVGMMMLISMAGARRFSPNGLPLLGASVVAMAALMCGNFMTIKLDSDISNRMPVLNDVWLYIHTNMIIASYALIGIAYVTAGMYVVGRLLTRPTSALWLSMLIPTAIIPLIGIIPGIGLMMVMPAWIPFVLIIAVTLLCMLLRVVLGSGFASQSLSVWEGLPLGVAGMVSGGGRVPPDPDKKPERQEPKRPADGDHQGLGKVLDGATMLLLELFFITLWTGIIMGAVWADHSWGRPWGWDPKEVFALNTWIIFLILVHVRIKVQDKALWTAVLAVIGCSVMLFNWIVVNFFITGLHSYA